MHFNFAAASAAVCFGKECSELFSWQNKKMQLPLQNKSLK